MLQVLEIDFRAHDGLPEADDAAEEGEEELVFQVEVNVF